MVTTEGPPVRAPKMTLQTCQVLRAFLEEPSEEMYGLQIGEKVELESGTIHPILARLERAGWVESRWEDVDPREQKRPRRRYYRLSSAGAVQAPKEIARIISRRGAFWYVLRPDLNGGAST